MPNTISDGLGVLHFGYSKTLPARSVGIASVKSSVMKPSDLVDIDNLTLTGALGPGALSISSFPTGPVIVAPGLNQSVAVAGSAQYLVADQFFETTNITDSLGNPLYYQHNFQFSLIDNVSILNLDGTKAASAVIINGTLYHSLDGAPYWVRYYSDGILHQDLLMYLPVIARGAAADGSHFTMTSGGLVTFNSSATYWFRFRQNNGYQLLAPYGALLNDPWYLRVRFTLRPVPQEYGTQPFLPAMPYMLATWVPGTVLASNLLQFERPLINFDGANYPDVIVYDKDYNLKYALDGSDPSRHIDKGYLYPWKQSQFSGIDVMNGRVQVAVDIAPDDIVYAFYSYAEKDLVFRALDVNPYTNPVVKNKVIEFYFADRGNPVPLRIT